MMFSSINSGRSIRGINIFRDVGPEALQRISHSCTWLNFKPGDRIVDHHDDSDEVFFISSGTVGIMAHAPNGKPISFRELGTGDTFGEIPAIDGGKRSATAEARTDCAIASMPGGKFRDLLAREPAVALEMLRQQLGTVRSLTTRVQEFSAAVTSIVGRGVYSEIQGIRAKDQYPDEEVKAHLVDKTFPESAEELTLRLSNVSAAFYGIMLRNVGERFGWGEIDWLSRRVFSELGRLKTREAIETGVAVPRDTRALALVFITAVHSASPEYNFDVTEYTPARTVIRVFGISRYDRIAKKLNIERHINWPELTPFFEGIAEEIDANCTIETALKDLGEGGRYDCTYKFALQ